MKSRKRMDLHLDPRFVILALMAEQRDHGLSLLERARKKGLGVGAGTVYPLLERMSSAEEGLLELVEVKARNPFTGGKPAKTYAITAKGVTALRNHLLLIQTLFSEGAL